MLIHLFSDTDRYEDFEMKLTVPGNLLFSELHEGIQKALDYDVTQMASFNIFNQYFEQTHEISLLDMGVKDTKLMSELKLEDIIHSEKQIINYLFDFFSERHFTLSIEKIEDSNEACFNIDVKGSVPPQIVVAEMDFEDELLKDKPQNNKKKDLFADAFNEDFEDDFNTSEDLFDDIDNYDL